MTKTLIASLGLSSSLIAAQNGCAPEPGATCYPDDCKTCYCLGPAEIIANTPVCPRTCDGDISISVSGFYWQAHQDGMEYAIDDRVRNNVDPTSPGTIGSDLSEFNNLVDAVYLCPNFKWDFGFKLALAYCSPCDGWDVGVAWTHFHGRASSKVEAEQSDNHVLLPLWTAFSWPYGDGETATGAPAGTKFATDIETKWDLQLDLIDIELGRDFWVSRYLAIRPHIGLRVACIEQDYDLYHAGGIWSAVPDNIVLVSGQDPLNNEVHLKSDFKGVGIRTGLDATWNLGCGWALYSDLATSIVYGRFQIDHDEWNRLAINTHEKIRILETDSSFRSSRAMLDLGLGVQWMGMVCDCKYGLLIALGWEQHLFFHQNQLWRVMRNGDIFSDGQLNLPNNTGENIFYQRRGNLDTQGITLKVKFDF